MTFPSKKHIHGAKLVLATSMCALAIAGCKHIDPGTRVAGWTLIDPQQRHPILVSQEPTTLNVHIARGSSGLTPRQRSELLSFAGHYASAGRANSRLIISVPSGSPNEVAAMNAVQQMRSLLTREGYTESDMVVDAYHSDNDPQPPIRVSYLQYVAQAPECGNWSQNLAYSPKNLPHPNMGCATQANLAAMVANPADLLGPRATTGRDAARRDHVFDKYREGELTNAKRPTDRRDKLGDVTKD